MGVMPLIFPYGNRTYVYYPETKELCMKSSNGFTHLPATHPVLTAVLKRAEEILASSAR